MISKNKVSELNKMAQLPKANLSRINNASLLGSALQMSWKLAIVVLIPLIGGVKLDQHTKTGPLFIIIGLILTILGVYYVLWSVLREFSYKSNQKDKIK